MKECTTCRLPKPPEEFPPDATKPGGRKTRCTDCTREYDRGRRRLMGVPVKVVGADCGNEHKECLKCHNILPLSEFYDATHGSKGKRSECIRCGKLKTPVSREKSRQKSRNYRARNPVWWRFLNRGYAQKRRAMKLGQSTGRVTDAVLRGLYDLEHCHYCQRPVDVSDRTVDHVIPLVKGGLHDPDNLVMACKSCNFSKSDRDLQDFLDDLGEVFTDDRRQGVMRFDAG